jgi:hypothetical protein
MAEKEPDNNSWLPFGRDLKNYPIVFGKIGYGKYDPLELFDVTLVNEKGLSGKTPVPEQPFTEAETNIARRDLGMSEQEVERLSRFTGKRWLKSLGVEYPKEWE